MGSLSLPQLAFCGLGAMGGGMARHLLKNGYEVIGFDSYTPLLDQFVEDGGVRAASPADAASKAKIFLLMVANHFQITSALFEGKTAAVQGLGNDSIVIICSTVPPEFCNEVRNRLDNEFKRPDIRLLDCPVSGGTPRAAAGTLSIFASGPEQGIDEARSILETLSAKLYLIPGGIGFGSKAKMCHQVKPEIGIAAASEVFALAAIAGLNTQEVFDQVQQSEGSSWIIGNRVPHMLENDPKVYSANFLSLKDSGIITNESENIHFPVFLVAAAHQVYQAAVHAGWGKDDDSTLPRLYLGDRPADLVYQQTKVSSSSKTVTIQTIIDLFAGIYLAASAEAMGFTEAVGLDTSTMYSIISEAAGSSHQFVKCVPQMKKPTWSLKDVPSAKDVAQKLSNAIKVGTDLGVALPIASTALQTILLHLSSAQ